VGIPNLRAACAARSGCSSAIVASRFVKAQSTAENLDLTRHEGSLGQVVGRNQSVTGLFESGKQVKCLLESLLDHGGRFTLRRILHDPACHGVVLVPCQDSSRQWPLVRERARRFTDVIPYPKTKCQWVTCSRDIRRWRNIRRRCRSDAPPHTPWSTLSASAYSRQSSRTWHSEQMRCAASTPMPSLGKKTSGSMSLHFPRAIQSVPIRLSSPRASWSTAATLWSEGQLTTPTCEIPLSPRNDR
jgi:hypothetical protein